MTDDTSRSQRLAMIDHAPRGVSSSGRKAAIVCLAVIIGLPFALKTLDQVHGKRKSSAVGRLVAPVNIADAGPASSCLGGFGLNSIWLSIGCANSPAPVPRP